MLFQTLVQLNLLILATPALAGWALTPLTYPGAARVACVVRQFRPAEAAASMPAAPAYSAVQAPARLPQSAASPPMRPAFPSAPAAVPASKPSFPPAIRAP